MQGRFDETTHLLDTEVLSASPQAPALLVHALHHLERYDEALARGQQLALQFPDNKELLGALATLTMDMQRSDLALDFAKRAGSDPEGRAALGLLTLGDHQTAPSLVFFDEAILAQPDNPRAWIGKGLALLSGGDLPQATTAIDKGAVLFETHVGSWIASGWAHLIAGDNIKARDSFERALALDPNFSESHGGLAVLNIFENRQADAERQTEIALRLDRNSFGAALAKILLLERSGNTKGAQKVRDIAFQIPIGPNGRTLAQELVAFGIAGHAAAKSGAAPRQRG
jgi:tetratricopeptide (TPR) repeat protein